MAVGKQRIVRGLYSAHGVDRGNSRKMARAWQDAAIEAMISGGADHKEWSPDAKTHREGLQELREDCDAEIPAPPPRGQRRGIWIVTSAKLATKVPATRRRKGLVLQARVEAEAKQSMWSLPKREVRSVSRRGVLFWIRARGRASWQARLGANINL